MAKSPVVLQTPLKRLQKVFGVDVRSLAIARILMSLCLLVSIASKYKYKGLFFTENGVFPQELIRNYHDWQDGNMEIRLSLLFLSKSEVWVEICFATETICTIMFMIGYHTRIANVLLWVLEVSFHHRALYIWNGGDDVVEKFLFWSMFLPMGDTLSFDRSLLLQKRENPKSIERLTTAYNGGSFAFVVQIFCIYYFSGLLKIDSKWTETGDAVYYTMNKLFFVKNKMLASIIQSHSIIWKSLTYGTLVLELICLWLLLLPIERIRTFVVFSFLGLHAGFFLSLELGVFPAYCVAYWVALLPGTFWERKFGWNLLVNDKKIVSNDKTRKTKSKYYGYQHCQYSHSRSQNLVVQIDRYFAYGWQLVAVVLTLVIVLPYNLSSVPESSLIKKGWTKIMKGTVSTTWHKTIATMTSLDQRWSFFSKVVIEDGWFLMPARLVSGKEIDVFRYGFLNPSHTGPIVWASSVEMDAWKDGGKKHQSMEEIKDIDIHGLSRIPPTHVWAMPNNKRLFKFMWMWGVLKGITFPGKESALIRFGHFICRTWNSQLPPSSSPEENLDMFQWVFMRQNAVGPKEKELSDVEPDLVLSFECDIEKSEEE